eukprot:CAMPEP_0174830020 /NCGR_PEP_ID=MMETSP1114-20130205/2292_1 /TAXON_ID=312471 /ORGANISM="Neobodo designis, Strain CCAP 1951/1" /LENGTH=1428 /DNA_ID=CAMNT_0016063803 /DNA_START=99 /DNA_END=4385 /DNA_ORIENTATION=-
MPSPRHSARPTSPTPTVLTTDADAATAWEQGAVIEDWAPFYFPSKTLFAELKAAAEAVVPQAAWRAHVSAADKEGRKPEKPEDVDDYMLRRNLTLGRRLHRLNCFIVSRLTPSLEVEIEEVRYTDGLKKKSFAVGDEGGDEPLVSFAPGASLNAGGGSFHFGSFRDQDHHPAAHASSSKTVEGGESGNPNGDDQLPPAADSAAPSPSARRSGRSRAASMCVAPSDAGDIHDRLRQLRETRAAEALAAQTASLHLIIPHAHLDEAVSAHEGSPRADGAPQAVDSPDTFGKRGMRRVASRGEVSLFAAATPDAPALRIDPPPALMPSASENTEAPPSATAAGLTRPPSTAKCNRTESGSRKGHHAHFNLDTVDSSSGATTPSTKPPWLSPEVQGLSTDRSDDNEFEFTRGPSIDIRSPTHQQQQANRRSGQDGNDGQGFVTNDSFAAFGHLSASGNPGGLMTSFSAMPVESQEQQLLEAVHAMLAFNEDLSERLREHVGQVSEFYQRTTAMVSGCAAACIEHLKQAESLSKRERAQVEKTVHQTAYNLAMLQEFCDHNFVAIHRFLKDLGGASFQRIEIGSSLMSQPFFMTRQNSSIAQLRELLIEYYTDFMCDGDRPEADARIARFADPDDGLDASGGALRLDRASQAAVAGLIVGTILALGTAVLFLFVGEQFLLKHVENGEHAAYLFSVSGVPILFALLFTANVAVWERYRINFAFSFHLHPFKHFTSVSVLIHNGIMAIVWLACAFFFLRAAAIEFAELEAARALDALAHCSATVTSAQASGNCSAIGPNDTTVLHARTVGLLLQGTVNRDNKEPLVPAYLFAYLVFPLALIVFIAGRVMKRVSGQPGFLLPAVGRLLATPYFSVSFTDFFVCEQLVSLADVFFEWTWLWCAFDTTGDATSSHYCREGRKFYICAIAMLPAWWRTLQSLRRFKDNPTQRSFYPHLLNATKYFISLVRMGIQVWFAIEFRGEALESGRETADGDTVVVGHNEDRRIASLVLFCVAYFIETIVKMGYEIWVEYGVMRCSSRNFLLRDTILFPRAMYYPCMIANFVIRWLWILKLLITKIWNDDDPQWAFPVFAVLEVLRRIMWNWFRVEYDQVDNTENYKAVQIAPLQSIRHASASVDWQLTQEDVERQFGPTTRSAGSPTKSPTATFNASQTAMAASTAAARHQDDTGTMARERTLDSVTDAPAPVRRPSSLVAAGPKIVTTKVAAFFHELPESERLEVLRTILPPSEFEEEVATTTTPPASDTTPRAQVSGNHKHHVNTMFRVLRGATGNTRLPATLLFNALHEEDKVRALLLRVGRDRTLDEYHAHVQRLKRLEVASATEVAPPRVVRRQSSALGQLSNNGRRGSDVDRAEGASPSSLRAPFGSGSERKDVFVPTPGSQAEEDDGRSGTNIGVPPAIVVSGTPTARGSSEDTPVA